MLKINLIGMVLNSSAPNTYAHILTDDNKNPLPASEALHALIMEYALVANGEPSSFVTVYRKSDPETEPRYSQLLNIKAAINEYYEALNNREHSEVAMIMAFSKIENILGMKWQQKNEVR